MEATKETMEATKETMEATKATKETKETKEETKKTKRKLYFIPIFIGAYLETYCLAAFCPSSLSNFFSSSSMY
jgi:ribosomal protein S19